MKGLVQAGDRAATWVDTLVSRDEFRVLLRIGIQMSPQDLPLILWAALKHAGEGLLDDEPLLAEVELIGGKGCGDGGRWRLRLVSCWLLQRFGGQRVIGGGP